jgi:hypothetical protein
LAQLGEPGEDVGPSHAEERPHDCDARWKPPLFRDPTQSAQACAAKQAVKHGLGLIVRCVSRGNVLHSVLQGNALEEGIPCIACDALEVVARFSRKSSYVQPFNPQRDLQLGAKRFDESLILVAGLTTKLVIEMGGDDRMDAMIRCKIESCPQERDTVRSARNADDHAPLHLPFTQRFTDMH